MESLPWWLVLDETSGKRGAIFTDKEDAYKYVEKNEYPYTFFTKRIKYKLRVVEFIERVTK